MVGIDILKIERVQLKDSFLKTVLTTEERSEYDQIRTDERRKEFVAGRIAAKEAIFKVTQNPEYLKYSVLHKDNGMPYVKDHPEMSVSISHDGGMVIAIVQI